MSRRCDADANSAESAAPESLPVFATTRKPARTRAQRSRRCWRRHRSGGSLHRTKWRTRSWGSRTCMVSARTAPPSRSQHKETMAFEIINPEAFGARPSGWSHGMLAEKGGRILFVAGQIAPVGDFVAQWGGALGRVMEVVRSAGGTPENVGRMIVYITDRRAYLANLTPLVEVQSLIDSKALVEIEAVAVL